MDGTVRSYIVTWVDVPVYGPSVGIYSGLAGVKKHIKFPNVLYSKSLKIFRVHSREHFNAIFLNRVSEVLTGVYSKYF